MTRRFTLLVLAALIGALALTACGGGGGGGGGASSKTFNVDATEFAFAPNTFDAKAGEEITFNVSNKGTLEHNFVVFDPSGAEIARGTIAVGATSPVKATPSAAGDYTVVCDVAGHKEAGMTGTLTVSP